MPASCCKADNTEILQKEVKTRARSYLTQDQDSSSLALVLHGNTIQSRFTKQTLEPKVRICKFTQFQGHCDIVT